MESDQSFNEQLVTFKTGDIFFTGTPDGVIVGLPPDRQAWPKLGDQITCSLEKLDELRFELV